MIKHLKYSFNIIDEQKLFVNSKNTKILKKNTKKYFTLPQPTKNHKIENTTKSSINYQYLTASYSRFSHMAGIKPGKRNPQDASILSHISIIVSQTAKLGIEWRRSGSFGIYLRVLRSLGEFNSEIINDNENIILDRKINWISKKTNITKFYTMSTTQIIQKINDVLKYLFKYSDLSPQPHHKENSHYAKDLFPLKTYGKNLKKNFSYSSGTSKSPKKNPLTHKYISLFNVKITSISNSILKSRKENYEKYLIHRKKYEKIDKLIKLFIDIMKKIGNDQLFTGKFYKNKNNNKTHFIFLSGKSITKLKIRDRIKNIFFIAKHISHCKTENDVNQLYDYLKKIMMEPIKLLLKLRVKKDIALKYKSGEFFNKKNKKKYSHSTIHNINFKPINFVLYRKSLLRKALKNTPFIHDQLIIEQQILKNQKDRIEKILKTRKAIIEKINNDVYDEMKKQIEITKITNENYEKQAITDEIERKIRLQKTQENQHKNNECNFFEDFCNFCKQELHNIECHLHACYFSCYFISKVSFEANILTITITHPNEDKIHTTKQTFEEIFNLIDLKKYHKTISVKIIT